MSIIREKLNRFIPDVLLKDIPVTKNVNIKSASDFILYINSQTKDFFPFLIIFGLVYFTSYQIYLGLYHSNDENPFNDNDFVHNVTKYVFLIFVPVFLLFCYIIHLTFDKQTEYSLFTIFIMFSFLAVILYYVLSNITIDFSMFNNYGTLIILFVIVITGLMILYNIFEKQIRNMDSWVGFVVNFIFYIPCLVDMFFKYMLENYINTPNWIITLFVCELLFILIYIYLLPIIKNKMTENAVVLLDKPVMLNEMHNELTTEMKKSRANKILNLDYLNADDTKIQNVLEGSTYRKHYSISMWIYVNPASYSRIGYTKESNIFYYGHEVVSTPTTPTPTTPTPTSATTTTTPTSATTPTPTSATTTTTPTSATTPTPTSATTTPTSATTPTPTSATTTPTTTTPTSATTPTTTTSATTTTTTTSATTPTPTSATMTPTKISASYHPKVSLMPVEDKYQFSIYYAGNEKKQFVELPYQKWNNLVFNYREGGVDLFVNGELNYSYSYATDALPDYTDFDIFVTGDNSDVTTTDASGNTITKLSEFSNGLYGAICNVVYYKNSQSKSQIVRNYNQLHFLNPPILP